MMLIEKDYYTIVKGEMGVKKPRYFIRWQGSSTYLIILSCPKDLEVGAKVSELRDMQGL